MGVLAPSPSPLAVYEAECPDLGGVALRIFTHIEPGYGVVPIVGLDAGSHMLLNGEVAVYDADWRDLLCRSDFVLQPGLYCIEHQRRSHGAPANSRRDVDREVVFVLRDPHKPDCWAYRQLRSRLHHGVRLPGRIEGPLYEWAMLGMMLGPIVGIFRPNFTEGAF